MKVLRLRFVPSLGTTLLAAGGNGLGVLALLGLVALSVWALAEVPRRGLAGTGPPARARRL